MALRRKGARSGPKKNIQYIGGFREVAGLAVFEHCYTTAERLTIPNLAVGPRWLLRCVCPGVGLLPESIRAPMASGGSGYTSRSRPHGASASEQLGPRALQSILRY